MEGPKNVGHRPTGSFLLLGATPAMQPLPAPSDVVSGLRGDGDGSEHLARHSSFFPTEPLSSLNPNFHFITHDNTSTAVWFGLWGSRLACWASCMQSGLGARSLVTPC